MEDRSTPYQFEEEVRSYKAESIDWDITEEGVDQFGGYPNLPDSVESFPVYGNKYWTEEEWTDEAVDTLSDLYCWTIRSCITSHIK